MGNIAFPPSVPVENRPSPNHAGARVETLGAFIHATRGPSPYTASTAPTSGPAWEAEVERQYKIAVDYMDGPNASSVGPHLCIGPSKVARMVDDDLIAWHATKDNPRFLGAEIAQDRWQSPFHPKQVEFAAIACALWSERYGFPRTRIPRQPMGTVMARGIIGHEDSYYGYSRGKSDPGYRWNWATFIPLVEHWHAVLFAPASNPVLSRTGPGLTDYYNANKANLGTPVDQWYDPRGNEVLVTSSTPAHPTGMYHVWRKALAAAGQPAIASFCWCHDRPI